MIYRFLIHRIISLNAFDSSQAPIPNTLEVPTRERGKPDRSCGLYIKASNANHSYYPITAEPQLILTLFLSLSAVV